VSQDRTAYRAWRTRKCLGRIRRNYVSISGPAAARCGGLSAHGHPAVRRPREVDPGARHGHAADKQILLVAQKQADVDDPSPEDLYRVGTLATILQLLKLPDGTVKVLVEGVSARA
jgi:hypothetical protein